MDAIGEKEALDLMGAESEKDVMSLFVRAAEERRRHFGDKVSVCSIINAKCGGCSEDCAFCAQSSSSKAAISRHPLLSPDEMAAAARNCALEGVERIGIVTSGRALESERELDTLCEAVKKILASTRLKPCASLGVVGEETLKVLKKSGLDRYHHNLEVSASYFSSVCSTRSYSTQIETVRAAKKAGLSVCCGGLFGIGETRAQRIELFSTIRELDVDSVPINFFIPIRGVRLENAARLAPLECLKIIAVARLMLPDKVIRVCGGREICLRDMQSWIFAAGAGGLMSGGYLTSPGRDVPTDMRMIKDAGMSPCQP